MNGKCQTKSVVYTGMMEVESDNPDQGPIIPVVRDYFGSAEGTFKTRYNGHKFKIEHRETKRSNLSAKYWQLLYENLNPGSHGRFLTKQMLTRQEKHVDVTCALQKSL